MIAPTFLVLAFAAVGLSQTTAPAGYRTVYITSMVDTKFVVVPKAAKAGNTIVVQTMAGKPEQQWYLTSGTGDSKIQLAGTTLCLDAGAKSAWRDMASVYVKDCTAADDASQLWNVMADGRIALKASSPRKLPSIFSFWCKTDGEGEREREGSG